jgi:hypothetical protein
MIKTEYFNPDEYKIIIFKGNTVLDSFTVVGKQEAMTRIMFYQKKIFIKIVETADMVYDQLANLKNGCIS